MRETYQQHWKCIGLFQARPPQLQRNSQPAQPANSKINLQHQYPCAASTHPMVIDYKGTTLLWNVVETLPLLKCPKIKQYKHPRLSNPNLPDRIKLSNYPSWLSNTITDITNIQRIQSVGKQIQLNDSSSNITWAWNPREQTLQIFAQMFLDKDDISIKCLYSKIQKQRQKYKLIL